jgi:hypothetical protein
MYNRAMPETDPVKLDYESPRKPGRWSDVRDLLFIIVIILAALTIGPLLIISVADLFR